MRTPPQDQVAGAVWGLAYGDAWGYPQEFKSWSQIERSPILMPQEAIISDDTQMSLYVIAALIADLKAPDGDVRPLVGSREREHVDEVRVKIADYLLHWLHDPDNNRAPGNTCLNSLFRLEGGVRLTGLEGTDSWSKGNGANIRCPWLGLLPLGKDWVALLAAVQASVTHNHPLALAAAAVTARVVQALATGDLDLTRQSLTAFLLEETERLSASPTVSLLPQAYAQGLAELAAYLRANAAATARFLAERPANVCALLGEGWVAEEALLVAAALTEAYATREPLRALYFAANSAGDSDSIGAICGAFVGAALGEGVFPAEWQARVEERYHLDLSQTVTQLGSLLRPQA